MPATLTSEQRLERIDHELEDVKRAFVAAMEQLASEPAVGDSLAERLATLVHRLDRLRGGLRPEDFDKDQIVALFTAYFEIRDLMDAAEGQPNLNTCDRLLVAIERIRHVVRDALDEHVTGVAGDRGLVLSDLRRWLPNTPLHTIATLIDVDRRTLSRWARQPGRPSPRLALVARLVAILRHTWTEPGVLAWFDRPRRDLEGRRPRALLGDPGAEDELIMAARAGRSQYAA